MKRNYDKIEEGRYMTEEYEKSLKESYGGI